MLAISVKVHAEIINFALRAFKYGYKIGRAGFSKKDAPNTEVSR